MRNEIICADVMGGLARLPDKCVQTVMTSPPYWSLRDYGVPGQIGLEPTVSEYVEKMVAVFAAVRDVLRDDGTVWLNMGDTWFGGRRGGNRGGDSMLRRYREQSKNARDSHASTIDEQTLKPKDMVLLPARVALALQDDGWWVRSEVIWHKPNPMPESIADRPTNAHEHIYLLSKDAKYYYDQETSKEPVTGGAHSRGMNFLNPKALYGPRPSGWATNGKHDAVSHNRGRVKQNPSFASAMRSLVTMRNMRSVWTISPKAFKEAHFATFPEELVRKCLTATSRPGDLVLDPFMGAGTVALVAMKMGREYIGIELNPEYVEMARQRLAEAMPLFATERRDT